LEETLVADAYYLATRSLTEDWKILWRTPSAWYRKARNKAVS
jgi:lipopolysaccharide/colanic/teichoic acid biosynthesis glycosyltransferase